MLTAYDGALNRSRTARKNPLPVPPVAKRSVAGGHPDFLKISTICLANPNESVSLAVHQISTTPEGAPLRDSIRIFSWAPDIVRSLRLSLNFMRLFSAVAALSCCAAKAISTFCCAAFALEASTCKPATWPTWVFRSVRSFRLSFSKPFERSLACAEIESVAVLFPQVCLFDVSHPHKQARR